METIKAQIIHYYRRVPGLSPQQKGGKIRASFKYACQFTRARYASQPELLASPEFRESLKSKQIAVAFDWDGNALGYNYWRRFDIPLTELDSDLWESIQIYHPNHPRTLAANTPGQLSKLPPLN